MSTQLLGARSSLHPPCPAAPSSRPSACHTGSPGRSQCGASDVLFFADQPGTWPPAVGSRASPRPSLLRWLERDRHRGPFTPGKLGELCPQVDHGARISDPLLRFREHPMKSQVPGGFVHRREHAECNSSRGVSPTPLGGRGWTQRPDHTPRNTARRDRRRNCSCSGHSSGRTKS